MSTIVTRSGKGSPLTHTEVDDNFTNLNTDKYQSGDAVSFTTLTATGQTSLGGAAGSEVLIVSQNAGAGRGFATASSPSAGSFRLAASRTAGNSDFELGAGGSTGNIKFVTSGSYTEQARITHTASAVNYVQVTGAATGGAVAVTAQGSDTNIQMTLQSKGAGTVNLIDGTNLTGVRVQKSTTGGDTFLDVQRNSALVELRAASGVTNGAFLVQSKGTGAIDLAAGSSGVNISNGGTVTAITRTAAGTGYTSSPTIAITAPTTAGGVQATATCTLSVNVSTPTITSGGTGYTVGNTLTFSGGTSTVACQLTVSSVSGGVITGVTVVNSGIYTVAPSNPISVTGGTGSGATFTSVWGVTNTPTITNAGSGYVEQPTVTFSGGGGSGAAAYATVGATTTFKSIGHTGTVAMRFDVPSSLTNNIPSLRLIDSSNAQDSGMQVTGGIGSAIINAFGATNATAGFFSSGTGLVSFGSGGTSQTRQLAVAHTASAVNYVQVTGAATGGRVTISSQGSDTNVPMIIGTKGSGSLNVRTDGSATTQFAVTHTSSAANYINVTGGAATNSPVISALGSDTNIPLVLQPKGTGALQAQQTDSTATGGNARGAYAVDWQTNRIAATQVASGLLSNILGGNRNTNSGVVSAVVNGTDMSMTGNNSFIGSGNSNTVSGTYSGVVTGYSNTAAGYYTFIGGGFTNSGTSGSAVTTQSATMNGTTAVTLSGSNASIKVGQYITGTSINTNTYVAAISGTSLTLSQAASGSSTSTLSFYTPHGVVVGGGNNQATGSYSFIGGGGDAGTAGNRNVASGDWSFVGGGIRNTASGLGAVVVGGGTDGSLSGNTASGLTSTVSGGLNNTASGNYSSITGGISHLSNGKSSSNYGGSFASARGITGNTVAGASYTPLGNFTIGQTQTAILVLARQTTDATATVLASDAASPSTTNQVILPNNSAYYFKGTVVAGKTAGGDTKGWTVEGVIKRGANAASTALVGTPTVTSSYADAGASTWTIAVTADTTNGGLAVTFTGQAGTTIRTVAKIETTEMTF